MAGIARVAAVPLRPLWPPPAPSLPSDAPTPTTPPARALDGLVRAATGIDACASDPAPHGPCAVDWTARRE